MRRLVILLLAGCSGEMSGGGAPGAPDGSPENSDAPVVDADIPLPPDAAPGPMPDATPTPPDAPGPPVVPVFTRASTEPVFSPDPESGWDNEGVWGPEVIRLGDDSWVMYYAANDNVGPHYAWSRAVSTDGITWTAQGPVWGGQNPSVIHDGTQFRAYVISYDDGEVFQLRSTDGLTWEIDPGEDIAYAYYPTVLCEDAGYKLWFMRGGQFWFATSPDGSTWTEHPDPLAITPQGAVAVIFDEGIYKMWFSQANDGIVYAVSPDGITWEVLGTSLAAGEMGDWDRYVWSPHVIRDGDVLKMWFTGSWWIFPDYYDPRIGYATSP